MTGSCPVCRRAVQDGAPVHPFCSDRCRLVDLGRWLDGAYRIPDEESPTTPLDADDGNDPGGHAEPDDTVH